MKSKSDFLDADGEFDGEKAYGAVIGTFLVCSWVEVILAFIKPKVGKASWCHAEMDEGGYYYL